MKTRERHSVKVQRSLGKLGKLGEQRGWRQELVRLGVRDENWRLGLFL